MGFFAAFGAGFAKDQSAQLDDQQAQRDKLTQLNLQNVLKNADSYNKSKSDYEARVSKATSVAAVTHSSVADALTLDNAGVPDDQKFMMLAKNGQKPLPGNTAQQTDAALSPTPQAGQTTGTPTPAAPNSNVVATAGSTLANQLDSDATSVTGPDGSTYGAKFTQPSSSQTTPTPAPNAAEGMVKSTPWDHLFGTDPSAGISAKAEAQAGAVTGMSPTDIAAARSGHFTPPAITGSTIQIKPSDLVDWSKVDPSKVSEKNMPAYMAALKTGDMQGAVSLEQNATDKEDQEIRVAEIKHHLDASNGPTSEQKNMQYQVTLLQTLPNPDNGGKPFTEQEAWAKVLKVASPSDVNPLGLTGEAYLATLKPQDAAVKRAYNDGRLLMPTGGGKGGAEFQQKLIQEQMAFDPTFDMGTAKSRFKTRLDMAPGGAIGKAMTSLNTTLGHLDAWTQSMKGLDNSSYPAWNSITNSTGSNTDNPKIGRAKADAEALINELTTTFRGNAGAEADIDRWHKQINENLGPKTQKEVASEITRLLNSRLDGMATTISAGLGKSIDGMSLLSPKAREHYYNVTGQKPDPEIIGKPSALDKERLGAAPDAPMPLPLGPDGKTDKASMTDGDIYQVNGHPPMKWDAATQQLMDIK